jgi:cytochrome c peroxidase
MKKNIVLLAVFLLAALFSFQSIFTSTQFKKMLETDLDELVRSSSKLNQAVQRYKKGEVNIDFLRTNVANTRYSFKKIEFLIEYLYPEFSENHLNGAPLFHTETSNGFSTVLPPEGLQVLDEKVSRFESEINGHLLAELSLKLESQCQKLQMGLRSIKVNASDIIEASKFQIVRISTMGISGFDTPGSLNSLEESKVSLEHIKKYITSLKELENKEEIQGILDSCIDYLNQNSTNFEDFNRLIFTRNYLNPLYTKLNTCFVSEPNPNSAVNPISAGMYEKDFLSPYFFTLLSKNEDSKALRELGKKLFFDPILSLSGKMSCSSCHNPQLAFTDAKKKSQSNRINETVLRNSPSLLNAVFADRYFYDLSAFNLEQQVEHVIFNSKEFNTGYNEILAKLNNSAEYKEQFKVATGKTEIDRLGFKKALASYVLSLQSFNSHFDQYMRKEIDYINPDVEKGFNLFMGKAACGTCHFPPTFSGLVPPFFNKNESEILGVLETPFSFTKKIDDDKGRMNNGVAEESVWIYEKSFKTPGIRNIAQTAPYFHNGSYPTLESVIDFYNHGGGEGIGLKVANQTLSPDSLNLNEIEKKHIIQFLNSLTDNAF